VADDSYRTVNLGASFDTGGLCYGCRHAENCHQPTSYRTGCECCWRESKRRDLPADKAGSDKAVADDGRSVGDQS